MGLSKWIRSLTSSTPRPALKEWRPLAGPLKTAWTGKGRLFVFAVANVLVGLIGALVPVFIPIFKDQESYADALITALRSGSLYTFGIALLASSITLVLQSDRREHQTSVEIEDTRRGSVVTTFAFLSLLGILTGMLAFSEALVHATPKSSWTVRDTVQCGLVGIAILIAIYLFLLSSYEEAQDSFAADEDAKVRAVADKSRHADTDARGIDLSGAPNA